MWNKNTTHKELEINKGGTRERSKDTEDIKDSEKDNILFVICDV